MSGSNGKNTIKNNLMRSLWLILLSLTAGICLVAGNVFPAQGWLFYPGLFLAVLIGNPSHLTRWSAYVLVLPYFLLLGCAVWQVVFPWYTGVLLALLLAELCGRVLYILVRRSKPFIWSFLILPGFLFLFDFVFRQVPLLNRINLFTLLSPVYEHRVVLALVSVFGASLTIWIMSAGLSALSVLASLAVRRSGTSGCLSSLGCRAAMSVLICCCILTGAGMAWYQAASGSEDGSGGGATIHVAAVQGSYHSSIDVQTNEDLTRLHEDRLRHYLDLARSVPADLYVFPELEFGIWDRQNRVDQNYRDAFREAAHELEGLIVLCVTEGDSITKRKEDRYFSAVLLDDAQVYGLTAKRNLVPFSETSRFSAGKRYDVYETPLGRIGLSICYDLQGPTVERLKQNGATLILAPFNDSGFGAVYHQIHRTDAALRAAECAIPIVMANEDGISQIVDARGRTIRELEYQARGVISADLVLLDRISPYLLFGRYIATAAAILTGLWFGWVFSGSVAQKKRNKNRS
ncbi:MAG: nitrilase-related carbon-nitrogen hydrolase [Bacillota bacterium]|nr:nitrilase-related carbon-nitrogen hydrolase [Bacillota bacterium]